jgi:hypothetical protein
VQQELEERLPTHLVVLEVTAQPLELLLTAVVVAVGTAVILEGTAHLAVAVDSPKEEARLALLAQE